MASGKSEKKLLENEKYMDDAVSSIFSNLHKAAKKKNNYIWSMNKFNALDNIWGDPGPAKPDDKVAKDSKSGRKSSGLPFGDSNTSSRTYKAHEIYPETGLRSSASESDKNKGSQNTRSSFDVKVLKAEDPQTVNFKEALSTAMAEKKDPPAGKLARSYISNASSSTTRNIRRSNYDNHTSPEIKSMIHPKEPNGSREIPQQKQTLVVDGGVKVSSSGRHAQQEEQRKRTRHGSGSTSTTNNGLRSQRKSSKRTGFEDKECNFDVGRAVAKTMLAIKILQDDHCSEFIVENSDFNRIRNKYPKVNEIFPDIDASEKEIPFSADAVKAVLGSLFNPPYDFNSIPDGRIAVEILSAANAWELSLFHSKFLQTFLGNLTKENSKFAYAAAVHYGLCEIADVCRTFIKDSEVGYAANLYRRKKCFLSVMICVEPREFDLNLRVGADTFQDSFPKDIRNEVIFEAVNGSFFITGFHVLLNDDKIKSKFSEKIDVNYSAKNLAHPNEEERVKISKPLRTTIVIYFRRKVRVNQGEKAEIFIESFGPPNLYFVAQESSERVKNKDGEFVLNVTGSYKEGKSLNMKRFVIGKLLYYPITL